MRGELRVLDRSGDTVVEWDTEVKDGPLAPEFVKQEFDRLVCEGHLAFVDTSHGGRKTAEQIKKGEFDPSRHEKVVLTPAFVGG